MSPGCLHIFLETTGPIWLKFSAADYWKSNERKYCQFCKCYIASNVASIGFHENGKKHKFNVTNRLNEIAKQSLKDEKAQNKVDMQMRAMEDGAMKAYALDLARGGDITTQSYNLTINNESAIPDNESSSAAAYEMEENNKIKETAGKIPARPAAMLRKRAIDPLLPPEDILEDEERRNRDYQKRMNSTRNSKTPGPAAPPRKSSSTSTEASAGSSSSATNEPSGKESSLWCEAKSDEGYTYYWNVKTGDSCWEPPKEGYMTIAEYNRLGEIVDQKQSESLEKESMFVRKNADEIVAKYRREELKRLRPLPTETEIKEEIEARENYQEYEESGERAARPYGKWQTIIKKEKKFTDYQLPKVEPEFIGATVSLPPEPFLKKFKEKLVTSISEDPEYSSVSNTFIKKPRSFGAKRNIRQKIDDD